MWLTNSSIGRKLVMSLTGAALVLFVTFHCAMNAVAILWPSAYNAVCGFLGANWYALVASMGLAALFVVHILYAVYLTLQNRKARGNDRYAVFHKPAQVEWSSQNMLVLGVVVVAFMAVHLIQFWARMQLVEVVANSPAQWYAAADGAAVPPHAGTLFIHLAFQQWWTPVVYIIGFVALWFHMNHGFWSMFQTAGWNGRTWFPRLKSISCWWTTIVIGLFVVQALWFTYEANNGTYIKDKAVLKQYAESYDHAAQEVKSPEEMQKLQDQFLKFMEVYMPEKYEEFQQQQAQYLQYQQMMEQQQQSEVPSDSITN